KTVDKIEAMTVRISKIIQGLRHFAREGGADPMKLTPVRQIVEETIDLCQAKYRKYNVGLDVDLPATSPEVLCRAVEISQVVLNLLSNAFDAVSESAERAVKLAVYEDEKRVLISVTDSGPGIPPDLREKIFLPFFSTKP